MFCDIVPSDGDGAEEKGVTKDEETNTATTNNTVSYLSLSTLSSLVNPKIHINASVAADPHNDIVTSGS